MEQPLQIDAEALAGFEVPVIRVSIDAKILYANKAMLDLVGAKTYAGLKVNDWLADPAEWERVGQELAKRAEGEASTYEVVAKRVDSNAAFPARVYAVPEVDANGNVTASLAFVTNLLEARVRRAMHEAIETRRTGPDILAALDGELSKLIKYRTFRLTAVSESRKHLRTLYSTQPNAGPPLRWWKMPPFVLEMIDDYKATLIDLDEFFSRPGAEQLLRDPQTVEYRKQGYKHTISIPVKQGESIKAFIGVESTDERPFTQAELDLCARLPLVEGALMALHYEETGRRGTVIQLIRELTAAFSREDRSGADPEALPGHIQQAASILVNRLAKYFEWEHVSIFRFDERTDTLRVLDQASHATYHLDKDFSVPVTKGLVGRAYRTGSIVNVGNVRNPAEAPDYVVGVENILSELCVPVPGHPIRWVVNIESKDENAFAEEEIATVEMLVSEAGNILERAALLEMRHAVLASVNDAVIEANSRGIVRRANPAAFHLLGVDKLVGAQIADFIVNADVKAAIEGAKSFPRMEASALREPESGRHEQVPIMISGAQLPPDLGGKVFVLSDVTYHKELKRLDLIKEVFRQAALETRVPLALAATYLAQAPEELKWQADAVGRILRQMRKADLPLERLLRLAGGNEEVDQFAVPIDLREMLDATIRELPASEQIQIDVSGRGSALVRVPRETLAFCVESMLSFALRTRPPDKKVTLEVERKRSWATVSVKGNWAVMLESAKTQEITGRWRRKAIEDLSLARDVLGKMAKRSGGSFRGRLDKSLALDLKLPVDSSARA